MRKDGCCGVQLGKIMNEFDCGRRRPSLKRNGSQQRDVDIDTSVTPPTHTLFDPFLSLIFKLLQVWAKPGTVQCSHNTKKLPTSTLSLHTLSVPKAP